MSASPEPHKPPAPTPWRLVLLLGALTGFAPVSIDMYLPSLPAIQQGLGASPKEIQASLSAFLAGMAIGQLIYGPASDRFGRRGPIFVGVIIYVLASIGCAVAQEPGALIWARFVQALGGCAGVVVARASIRDRFDHQDTARVLSLMTAVMGLGPIFSPSIGGLVLTLLGWRGIFWLLAAFGTLVGIWAAVELKESRSEETAAQARSEGVVRALGLLLANPRMMGYALAAALNGAMLFSYIAASPDLIIKTYGASPISFGWLFALNAAGLIIASQVNRHVLRRVPADRVLARASLATSAAAVMLAFFAFTGIGGAWSVLASIFLLLASFGFVQGNAMAGALSVDPRRAGSISALMGALSFGAGAAASTLTALFHDGTPRPLAVCILVAAVGSSLALFSLVFRRPATA